VRRMAWLAAAVVAASGCAASYDSGRAAPADTRPAVAQRPAIPTQPGCPEPAHQPFPSDEGLAIRYPKLEAIRREYSSYPELAREQRVQGLVLMRALVCEHGRVVMAYPLESVPLLDEAALEALRRSTFRPKRLDGQPIAAWTDVPYRFTLH
jgi:periplasmic protein TonB